MKLYFSRNPNPRLAVATARHLQAKVEFEFAAPFAPGQAERFRPLNPESFRPHTGVAGRQPVGSRRHSLQAVARGGFGFLAQRRRPARHDPLAELGQGEFRPGLRHGPFRARHQAALRDWPDRPGQGRGRAGRSSTGRQRFSRPSLPGGNGWSAVRLPMPISAWRHSCPSTRSPACRWATIPAVFAWYRRLEAIDAWRDPFEGLDAPHLPPVKPA